MQQNTFAFAFALFFLLGVLNAQVQIELLEDTLESSCAYARFSTKLVWHCPGNLIIYEVGTIPQKFEIDLGYVARNLKIIPSEEDDIVYLLRESQVIEVNITGIILNGESIRYIFKPSSQVIDYGSNVQLVQNHILYKEKNRCVLRRLDVKNYYDINQPELMNIKFFQHFDDGEDCQINFTSSIMNGKLVSYIYIKDSNNLIIHTYDNEVMETVNSDSYLILPTFFKFQFDKFSLRGSNNVLLMTTYNHFDSKICLYLLNNQYFTWHLQYSECGSFDLILHTENIIGMYKSNINELTILSIKTVLIGAPPQIQATNKVIKKNKSSSTLRISLSSDSYPFTIGHKMDIIVNYHVDFYCISRKKFTEPNSCDAGPEPTVSCEEYLDVLNSIDPFAAPTSSCSQQIISNLLKLCPDDCATQKSSCSSCITSKLNTQCLGFNEKLVCKDLETPLIVQNECVIKEKKYNGAFQYNLDIKYALDQTVRCHMAFDFGAFPREIQFSFWRSNQTSSIASDLNLEMYDKKGAIKSKVEKMEGVTIRMHYYHVNSIYIDYRVYFQQEPYNKYAVLTIAPIPTTYSCISCLAPSSFVSSNSQSISNAWVKDEYRCVDGSEVQEQGIAQNWYECFLEEINSPTGTICEIKEEDKDQMIIIFKKDFEYPYCKIPISMTDRLGLNINYDLHDFEDIIIQTDQRFFTLRNIISEHENKISEVVPLSQLSQINLLFFSLNGNKTVDSDRLITVKFGPESSDALSVLGLLIINALGVLLVICICLCRASADLSDNGNETPYEIANFQTGCPKRVKLSSSQVKELTKQGYTATKEGSPVSLETSECCICLEFVTEREFRVFLCGRHYVHLDCFDTWIEAQLDNGGKDICPMRCKDILVNAGESKDKKKQKQKKGDSHRSHKGNAGPMASESPTIQPLKIDSEDKRENLPTIVLHSLDTLKDDKVQVDISFDQPYKNFNDEKSMSILNFQNRSDMPFLETEDNDTSHHPKDDFMVLGSLDDIPTRNRQSSLVRIDRQSISRSPINGLRLPSWELDLEYDRERSTSNVGLLDGRSSSPDIRDYPGLPNQNISEEGSSIESEEGDSSPQRGTHQSDNNDAKRNDESENNHGYADLETSAPERTQQ